MRESAIAKKAYQYWYAQEPPRSFDLTIQALMLDVEVMKAPSKTSLYQWKSRYKWEERAAYQDRLSPPTPVYLDQEANEIKPGSGIPNFQVIVQHRGDYDRFTYSAGEAVAHVMIAYQKKLFLAADRLEVPKKVSINEMSKMINGLEGLIKSAKTLHDLHLDVEGLNVLIEERLS